MESERRRVANELRSLGQAEAEKIRADADRQREVILAEAYRDAQRIKGEGDARASAIYAQAYGENPEFYAFYRSLEAYRATFRNRSDVMVLEPDLGLLPLFPEPGRPGPSPASSPGRATGDGREDGVQESLLAAFALMLVIEGLLPLFAPRVWRDSFRRLLELTDGQLRFIGLVAIALGLIGYALVSHA